MAVVFALLSAASFGAADFAGGSASRRASATRVVLWSQLIGLAALLAIIGLLPGEPTGAAFGIGALAGLAGTVGLVCLYAGLALGPMAVVSPITALLAALIPSAWGLATGDRLTVLPAVGAVLAVVGGLVVSRGPEPDGTAGQRVSGRAVALALASGTGFGLFFIILAMSDEASGSWPLVGSRLASMTAVLLVTVAQRESLRPPTGAPVALVLAGLFDIGGNVAFLAARERGLLTIVAVVVSLYPASTVVLARIIDHERIGRLQGMGLVIGAVAVAFIAGG